ncbi:MAG: winged helix-turn-helix domain-containing protein [Methanomassiliicoccales archaeon]
MSEDKNELLRRIEELRQGLDALGRSVTSLRKDEMENAFHDQIGASFLENNRDAVRSALQAAKAPPLPVLNEISDLYDVAMERYEINDLDGALSTLDQVRELAVNSLEGVGANFIKILLPVLDTSRQQMAMMETLRFHTGRPGVRRSVDSAYAGMEPEKLEGLLSPLSNAIRLKILALLYTDSRSFSEMVSELQIQKGHLQFHIRKLVDAGYIKVDRRTHLYSIEIKGLLAVEGLGQLFSKL